MSRRETRERVRTRDASDAAGAAARPLQQRPQEAPRSDERTGMSRLGDIASAVRALISAESARPADPAPWTPLRKPLSDCTLAIVSSSAYADVAPKLDRPGVELCGFRTFSDEAPESATAAGEAADRTSTRSDFEADRLGVTVGRARELVAAGRIARLSRRHLTLSGAVDSCTRLVRETRRTAAPLLAEDQIDVVLLVPM
jgi:D-proline reductase (dithiol) PrdB